MRGENRHIKIANKIQSKERGSKMKKLVCKILKIAGGIATGGAAFAGTIWLTATPAYGAAPETETIIQTRDSGTVINNNTLDFCDY